MIPYDIAIDIKNVQNKAQFLFLNDFTTTLFSVEH